MDWGAEAGRVHTVREPPPQFVALLQKTGTVRDAAKAMMTAEQTRDEAATLKPAFNAVPTFNMLSGVDDINLDEIANLVFCVTTGRPRHPVRSPFYAVTQTQQRIWVGTDLSVASSCFTKNPLLPSSVVVCCIHCCR